MSKVYLIKVNAENTDSYEDYWHYSDIIAAFAKKEDAKKYIYDVNTLYKEHCQESVDSNGACIKDIMSDVKWEFEIDTELECSTIHLKEYFMAFKNGKYDKDGDRNDPKNWRAFWSLDYTEFSFSIQEMELR